MQLPRARYGCRLNFTPTFGHMPARAKEKGRAFEDRTLQQQADALRRYIVLLTYDAGAGVGPRPGSGNASPAMGCPGAGLPRQRALTLPGRYSPRGGAIAIGCGGPSAWVPAPPSAGPTWSAITRDVFSIDFQVPRWPPTRQVDLSLLRLSALLVLLRFTPSHGPCGLLRTWHRVHSQPGNLARAWQEGLESPPRRWPFPLLLQHILLLLRMLPAGARLQHDRPEVHLHQAPHAGVHNF
jgi:hypothetical protein